VTDDWRSGWWQPWPGERAGRLRLGGKAPPVKSDADKNPSDRGVALLAKKELDPRAEWLRR
jgi:hypothetical protein